MEICRKTTLKTAFFWKNPTPPRSAREGAERKASRSKSGGFPSAGDRFCEDKPCVERTRVAFSLSFPLKENHGKCRRAKSATRASGSNRGGSKQRARITRCRTRVARGWGSRQTHTNTETPSQISAKQNNFRRHRSDRFPRTYRTAFHYEQSPACRSLP